MSETEEESLDEELQSLSLMNNLRQGEMIVVGLLSSHSGMNVQESLEELSLAELHLVKSKNDSLLLVFVAIRDVNTLTQK